MRRSMVASAAAVAAAATMALAPVWAIGPGGWDHVGTGSTASTPSLNGKVSALNTQLPGVLYVGGNFTNAGGHANADRIAKWNGSAWSAIGSKPLISDSAAGEVSAIAYNAGKVYVGGTFQNAGGNADADFLAVWDGVNWAPFCTPTTPGPAFGGSVDALQIVGNTLYVGGAYQNGAGIAAADYLLACDLTSGASSATVNNDGDFTGAVYDLTADSNGTLYAGGNFINLDQILAADHVAAYDGAWHAMGSAPGPAFGAVDGIVRSLTASGTNVYVGTDASDVAGIAQADHVARWDASTLAWSAVGANTAGTNGWFPTLASIYALSTGGPLVFAAGSFQNANGTATADSIAYFDGTTWRPIGSNGAGNGPLPAEVHALRVFSSKVYAGGNFTSAGGDTKAWSLAAYALRQPDNSISTVGSGPYVGNGVYNTTGVGQARTLSIQTGHHDEFIIKIQNDGLVATSFKVKATGGANGIHAAYAQGTDITSEVKAGTYSTSVLAPKAWVTLRLRVHVDLASAAGTNFYVTTRSVTGTQPDTVRAKVETHD